MPQQIIVDSNNVVRVIDAGPIGPSGIQGIPGEKGDPGTPPSTTDEWTAIPYKGNTSDSVQGQLDWLTDRSDTVDPIDRLQVRTMVIEDFLHPPPYPTCSELAIGGATLDHDGVNNARTIITSDVDSMGAVSLHGMGSLSPRPTVADVGIFLGTLGPGNAYDTYIGFVDVTDSANSAHFLLEVESPSEFTVSTVTSSSGISTAIPITPTVPVTSGRNRFRVELTGAGAAYFYIGDELVSTHSTNVPSQFPSLCVGMHKIATAGGTPTRQNRIDWLAQTIGVSR